MSDKACDSSDNDSQKLHGNEENEENRMNNEVNDENDDNLDKNDDDTENADSGEGNQFVHEIDSLPHVSFLGWFDNYKPIEKHPKVLDFLHLPHDCNYVHRKDEADKTCTFIESPNNALAMAMGYAKHAHYRCFRDVCDLIVSGSGFAKILPDFKHMNHWPIRICVIHENDTLDEKLLEATRSLVEKGLAHVSYPVMTPADMIKAFKDLYSEVFTFPRRTPVVFHFPSNFDIDLHDCCRADDVYQEYYGKFRTDMGRENSDCFAKSLNDKKVLLVHGNDMRAGEMEMVKFPAIGLTNGFNLIPPVCDARMVADRAIAEAEVVIIMGNEFDERLDCYNAERWRGKRIIEFFRVVPKPVDLNAPVIKKAPFDPEVKIEHYDVNMYVWEDLAEHLTYTKKQLDWWEDLTYENAKIISKLEKETNFGEYTYINILKEISRTTREAKSWDAFSFCSQDPFILLHLNSALFREPKDHIVRLAQFDPVSLTVGMSQCDEQPPPVLITPAETVVDLSSMKDLVRKYTPITIIVMDDNHIFDVAPIKETSPFITTYVARSMKDLSAAMKAIAAAYADDQKMTSLVHVVNCKRISPLSDLTEISLMKRMMEPNPF